MSNKMVKITLLWLCALCLASTVFANTVEKVLGENEAAINDGQTSQQKVDTLATSTRDAMADFRQTNKITEDLDVYNKKLNIQIIKQQEQLQKINRSMGNVHEIQSRMFPLAIKMIDSLERFIQLDIPFALAERKERIALLRTSMDRPEVSVAEKFRQVLEAYQIENEYGRHIKTYQQALLLGGKKREVNILQIGRIALMYQTTDGNQTGVWDKKQKKWVELSSSKYRSAVQKGISVAKKQAAIDILILPIAAPEVFRP